jgi:flagellar hook assembly protein FlgD
LPEEANVKLAVFDVLGRQVAELASGVQQKGYYSVTWDGTSVASGVYYARFTIIDGIGNVRFTKINKLLLMK